MHIAYIHQHFSTRSGQTGTRSYEMSRRLIAAGHRVTMICGMLELARHTIATGKRVSESDMDGIRVLCIAEPYANRMGFTRRLLAFGRFARTATRLVSQLDADLVFATSTPLTVGIPGMKAAQRLNVPFVFEVRDLWPEIPIAMGVVRNPLLKWYTRRLERKIYFAADHIIALAPGIKDGIHATGYTADKISLIPNCCDLDLFSPDHQPHPDARFENPAEFRLVFTGAHGQANGLDAVLDAAQILKQRGVSGIRLIFIGAGGEKPRLIKRSETEGLQHLVTWIDPVSKTELAGILAHMDVGLMILKNIPSFYYGTSPNKFFDYIANGMAVLNNYPGWVADMIQENKCGLIVKPDDPQAFADAVVWFRDHREETRTMGQRARRLAESSFDRDQLGDQFVNVLEKAADSLP